MNWFYFSLFTSFSDLLDFRLYFMVLQIVFASTFSSIFQHDCTCCFIERHPIY